MTDTEIFGHTPLLEAAIFRFVQDGNTVGTTDETELLEISLETQLPGLRPFVVLKSATGWSVDEISELTDLVQRVLDVASTLAPMKDE